MPQTLAGNPTDLSNNLIRQGKSLSGRERNCCFLNTGRGRFADISAISGADFDDDARALGIVDWDFDGDLDFWVVNRTGPQVRYLRNDLPPGDARHFLALKVQGANQGTNAPANTCNRDAIGARVEVHLMDQAVPLLKTVRAGDGFLSQSSKWLHFGLGASREIDRVVIRWPGGKPQTLTGLEADRWYRVVQGAQAESWTPPRPAPLESKPLPQALPGDAPRVLLSEPVPLPRLEFTLFGPKGGQPAVLDQLRGRPALISLWASWCAPCAAELGELNERRGDLAAKGLVPLALSIDGLYDDRSSRADAEALLKRVQYGLPAGMAGKGLLDKLQLVHDELFDRHSPFGLPCSFLIDAEGRLAAIYRGRVSVATVLEDVQRLALASDERLVAALPFPGWWGGPPTPRRLLPIAKKLVQQGLWAEAWEYVSQNKANVRQGSEYPSLLLALGQGLTQQGAAKEATSALNELVELAPQAAPAHFALASALELQGDLAGSLRHFQKTASLEPKHAEARQIVAMVLATSSDPSLRNPAEALRWAKEAVALTGEKNPAYLDTLAVAHAVLGEFSRAVEVEQQALKLATTTDPDLVPALKSRIEAFRSRRLP